MIYITPICCDTYTRSTPGEGEFLCFRCLTFINSVPATRSLEGWTTRLAELLGMEDVSYEAAKPNVVVKPWELSNGVCPCHYALYVCFMCPTVDCAHPDCSKK